MSIFDLFKQIENEQEKKNGPITNIIVGLGNPGKEYENTRHNSGFMVMDILSAKYGVEINKSKFDALTAEAVVNGKRTLLMKPQTFMNLSGNAVKKAADFYKIPAQNITVICDDVNLDVGKIRIRRKGSDGGQKGLRDIIAKLGTDEFIRIRVGVGKLPQGGDMVSWVLGRIPKELDNDFKSAKEKAADAVTFTVIGDIDTAMNRFN